MHVTVVAEVSTADLRSWFIVLAHAKSGMDVVAYNAAISSHAKGGSA